MGNQVETVTVEIGDRPYTLKAGNNPEYIREVANFVDRKMKEIGKMAPSLQPTHLAVLTAINIADELFENQQGPSSDTREVENRIEALIRMIPGEATTETGA
jgi:cell division protein ZapA